jgi:hypothetical protein
LFAKVLKSKEDVDGRAKPGHDDAERYLRISHTVMAGLMPAIHVLLSESPACAGDDIA